MLCPKSSPSHLYRRAKGGGTPSLVRGPMGRKGLSYFNFIGLAYEGKHIVFRFDIKYSNLRDFGPYVVVGLLF
jgi:hypothetical protein